MKAIGVCRKACVQHFHWSVTSTKAKLQSVILAKFKSLQYHTLNQHTEKPERLFNKGAHGAVTIQHLWLTTFKVTQHIVDQIHHVRARNQFAFV